MKMKNTKIIPWNYLVYYKKEINSNYKLCFFEKIGATILKEMDSGGELQIDLIEIESTHDRWQGYDPILDAARIAIQIELLSGHQFNCSPDFTVLISEESVNLNYIFNRRFQENQSRNLCGINDFPLNGNPDDEYYQSGNQYYIKALKVNEVWKKGLTGAEIKIGIVDTGIDTNNPDLRNRVAIGYNFTTQNEEDFNNTTDTVGHGTNVAGIVGASTNNKIGIAAVSPGTVVVPFKVGNALEYNISALFDALMFVISQSRIKNTPLVHIINISSGAYVSDTFIFERIKSIYTVLIDDLLHEGILVVASAGNESTENEFLPAGVKNVISVGAINRCGDDKSRFSNYGKLWVDVAAPGEEITTTDNNPNKPYMSGIEAIGTSLAAPQVSGILALMYEHVKQLGLVASDYETARIIRQALYDSATKHSNMENFWKYGVVDALKAINTLPQKQPNEFCLD